MASIAFDTLGYSKTLQSAGIPAEQADAFANAQKTALEQLVEVKDLATKGDLMRLQMQLEAKITESQLKNAESHQNLLRWILGIACAQVALVIAMLSFIKQ